MSLIRKILGMKDLSAEFDIPEVKLNKKSIPKEKKIDKPTPEPVYEKVNHIPNYDSPPPPFNKIELEWVKKLSVAKKTISKRDLISQVNKAKFKEISNTRILELLEYVYKQ